MMIYTWPHLPKILPIPWRLTKSLSKILQLKSLGMHEGKGQGLVFMPREHRLEKTCGLWRAHGTGEKSSSNWQPGSMLGCLLANPSWTWQLCVATGGMLLLNAFIDLLLGTWFPLFCGTQKEKASCWIRFWDSGEGSMKLEQVWN